MTTPFTASVYPARLQVDYPEQHNRVLIGAPMLLTATIAVFFGIIEPISPWTAIATLPIAAWEFSLGIWLTFKGFKACPITDAIRAERTPPAPIDALT